MNAQEINLFWHNYKFFPYEKRFALREVQALLEPLKLKEYDDRLIISGLCNSEEIKKLVYFSHAQIEKKILPTMQFHFENRSGNVKTKRQNTRYSVHGLHEYKGKFNPQVVKSLFNIYGIKSGDYVLDPFCGSGTTLVEAAHADIHAKGTDINPLAAFIANTKIEALKISGDEILEAQKHLFKKYSIIKSRLRLNVSDPRIQYLTNWFPENTLKEIEALRLSALELSTPVKNIILVTISNLLRDYSYQEPSDLRIRRRFSPFPDVPFLKQLRNAIESFADNLNEFQKSFKLISSKNTAFNSDIKYSKNIQGLNRANTYDFAITSPPYATALPYIDTQRLSLIWLDFISAKDIKSLESDLIGSREFKTKGFQEEWFNFLIENSKKLPEEIHSFCIMLNSKLQPQDGFRKRALPPLLYRYFYDMLLAFKEVHRLLKNDKYFCLIVGHNHTTIGGEKTAIDTPKLLSYVGREAGFKVHEILELDAYQRYGLNASNAVQKESLIVFKK